MSKKKSESVSNGVPNFGEISTIREILMGDHINDFEKKFVEMQDQINNLEDKLNEKIKELAKKNTIRQKDMEKEFNSQFSNLESNNESRFSLLEKSLQDGLSNLESLLEESSLNNKEKIGRLLMEAGQNLLKS